MMDGRTWRLITRKDCRGWQLRREEGEEGEEMDTDSVPLRRRMRNCSGERMASHSSSDFCTDPGGGDGADEDIATTPCSRRRPAVPRHRLAAHWLWLQCDRGHERVTC